MKKKNNSPELNKYKILFKILQSLQKERILETLSSNIIIKMINEDFRLGMISDQD